MPRLLQVSALLFLALLTGCGGGGNSSPNPYPGTYSGPWYTMNDVFQGENLEEGMVNLVVGEQGQMTGTFSQTKPPIGTGTINGIVNKYGQFDFTVTYPGSSIRYAGEFHATNNQISGSFYEPGVGYGGFTPYMNLTKQ